MDDPSTGDVRRAMATLEEIQRLADTLMTDLEEGGPSGPTELIEIVSGAGNVLDRFDQFQRAATTEIQVLDTPPYRGRAGPETNDLEFEVLERGVTCKAIYDRAALEKAPRAIHAIARFVEAGEQARVTTRLPLKLAIFDREVAYLPQSADQQDIAGAIVVHPSALLDVLLYVFDELWTHATPLAAKAPYLADASGTDETPSPDDRRLLGLLATGMKDEAIAHHLDWSYRTTRRRIADLMTRLRADTRFQAGLYASRRGWL